MLRTGKNLASMQINVYTANLCIGALYSTVNGIITKTLYDEHCFYIIIVVKNQCTQQNGNTSKAV